MQARKLILSALVGGPVLGALMGFAAQPEMIAPPEPAWRQVRPDPIFAENDAPDSLGASVFMTTYDLGDRTPTWKRRAMARAIALGKAHYAEVPLMPAFDEEPEPAAPLVQIVPSPLDQAADEARDAVRAAQAPAAEDAQSAAVEPEPAPAIVS